MSESKKFSDLVDEFARDVNLKLMENIEYTLDDILPTIKKIKEFLVEDRNINCTIEVVKSSPDHVRLIVKNSIKEFRTCVIPSEIIGKKVPAIN